MNSSENAATAEYFKVKGILSDINWNFHQTLSSDLSEQVPFDSRKHLPYPGTYVPEIPFTLIELLTMPKAKVLDPFSGSGTTFFQSIILDRQPRSTDICLVSIEYIRSISFLFTKSFDRRTVSSAVIKIISAFDRSYNYEQDIQSDFRYLDKLRPWYEANTFNMLCYLFKEVIHSKNEIIKTFIHVSLLSLLKNSSSQDRGWGCIADNMLPKTEQLKEKNVFRNLLSKVNQIAADIELSSKNIHKKPLVGEDTRKIAINSDIRHTEIETSSIDCVITSPPYPNMTDYITSQRLNYYYLNADPDKEKFNETGARFKRNRLDSNERYKIEMKSINHHLYDLLKPSGYLCLILPEFGIEIERDQNRKAVIADIIANLEEIGFVKRDIFERILPSMRRSHNQKWASLEKEKIYIYQKPNYEV